MRVTDLTFRNFLGIEEGEISLDRSLTVVTGVNGSGKSTLFHGLAVIRAAVAASGTQTSALTDTWASAGHNGSDSFRVTAGITFDEPDEQSLIDAFTWAAVYGLLHPEGEHADQLAAVIDNHLPTDAAQPLMRGTLVVDFDLRRRHQWQVAWEFTTSGRPGHIQLIGPEVGSLVDGTMRDTVSSRVRKRELLPSTNKVLKAIRDGAPIDPWSHLPGASLEFVAATTHFPTATPLKIADLWRRVGISFGPQQRVTFGAVLSTLLNERMQLTDNHRAPVRTSFDLVELTTRPDLQDGSMLALEIHRLKNGNADGRRRFRAVQATFQALTGRGLDCMVNASAPDGQRPVTIEPIVVGSSGRDVPLAFAGAGAAEALHLAVLLADERRCVFLDEPAVHLAPTLQRRLLTKLRDSAQVVINTHTASMVPSQASDLGSVIRLSKGENGTRVTNLAGGDARKTAADARVLASNEVRTMLFAAGVVLFEGPTDLAAFGVWLDRDDSGLPTPDERNVLFLSVDGQNSFGLFVDLARRLEVPWVIVADGPALRPGSVMAGQLSKLGVAVPSAGDSLKEVRADWTTHGVYSLAEDFGDDGSKVGEIENFMKRTDIDAYSRACVEVGARKGNRVGAAFAASVPLPDEVRDIWQLALARLP